MENMWTSEYRIFEDKFKILTHSILCRWRKKSTCSLCISKWS
jgi:hypothetical protein